MNDARALNIWEHTLDQICNGNDSAKTLATESRQGPETPSSDVTHSSVRKIKVLDLPTRTTAILSWSDPTSCRYAYQCWCMSRAERFGVCVLSGFPIAKGDEVYQPRASRPRPRNANAMILRRAMECGHAGATFNV